MDREDRPPEEQGLGTHFVRLAELLDSSFTAAFVFYNLVKANSGSRITPGELNDLVASLPAEERTTERVSALLGEAGAASPPAAGPDEPAPATRRRGRAARPAPPTAPQPGRIEWRNAPSPENAPPPAGLPPESPAARSPAARRRRTRPPASPPPIQAAPPISLPEKKGDSRVEWGGGGQGGEAAPGAPDLAALVGVDDAYEHTPLEAGEKVAFCRYDQVAYHLSTWDFLQVENGGRCCACGRAGTVVLVTLPGTPSKAETKPELIPAWMDTEKVIRLEEVHNYIGQAVTIEDYVWEVYQTKNTGTYFVRFEERLPGSRPFDGFKVVIFPRYQAAWAMAGLSPASYAGQIVRVRGVIQTHEAWGIEILVNSPRMIQVVTA